jgi:hypothetical protein
MAEFPVGKKNGLSAAYGRPHAYQITKSVMGMLPPVGGFAMRSATVMLASRPEPAAPAAVKATLEVPPPARSPATPRR